jgi:hypothetical protein
MPQVSNNVVIVSTVNIIFLGVLFVLCIHGYLQATSRRSSRMSAIFFGCMGISLVLEMPQSIWYSTHSNHFSTHLAYKCASISHYFAVSGFTFCIGIPICVWAGMITGNEISIFELGYTTPCKTVLHFTIVLTIVNDVMAFFLYFQSSEQVGWCFYVTVLVSQLLISFTWLCVGISLQRMVAITAVIGYLYIVISLNIVILSVFLCYLTRPVFVIMFNYVIPARSPSWNIFWNQIIILLVPYCVGNLLLIRFMTVSLKYEHRIESRLLKSSRADSVTDAVYLTLSTDAWPEYAEVPEDEN